MNRRGSSLVAYLACLVLCLAPAVSASAASSDIESATTFQIGPAHDGRVEAANVRLPFKRAWSIPASAASYPIIAQGLVIVTTTEPSGEKTLRAFDAKDGRQIWSQSVAGPYGFSNATYEGGRVFVVTSGGLVQAFDAATGASGWAMQLESVGAPPTATGGTLFVDAYNHLYALDESTGAQIWRSDGGGSKGAATIADGEVMVSSGCAETFATNLDGAARWHYMGPCYGGGGQTIASWNGSEYVRDTQGNLVLDGKSGDPTGAFASDEIPAFDELHMFTVSEGSIHALGLDDGIVDWASDPALGIVTPPLVMNAWVIVGSSDGQVYAFDRATGDLLWSGEAGSAIPAPDEWNVSIPVTGLGAAGPLLVVPTVDHLVAFRAEGPWTIAGVPPIAGEGASASGSEVSPTEAPGSEVSPTKAPGSEVSPTKEGGGIGWIVLAVVVVVGTCGALGIAFDRRSRLARDGGHEHAAVTASWGGAGASTTPRRPDLDA